MVYEDLEKKVKNKTPPQNPGYNGYIRQTPVLVSLLIGYLVFLVVSYLDQHNAHDLPYCNKDKANSIPNNRNNQPAGLER